MSTKMSPEAQCVAIAEVCPRAYRSASGEWVWDHDWYGGQTVFNPVEDLNAAREAENGLTFEQWFDYVNWIIARSEPNGSDAHKGYEICHASAPQRAEAFLRTIGQWKEEA